MKIVIGRSTVTSFSSMIIYVPPAHWAAQSSSPPTSEYACALLSLILSPAMCGESILGSDPLSLDPIILVLNSPGQAAEFHHLWNLRKCVRTSETCSQMEILPSASVEVSKQGCHAPFPDVRKIESSKNQEPLAMTHLIWSDLFEEAHDCALHSSLFEHSYCVVPTISLSFSFVVCNIKAWAQMTSKVPSSSDVLWMCFHTFPEKRSTVSKSENWTKSSDESSFLSFFSSVMFSFLPWALTAPPQICNLQVLFSSHNWLFFQFIYLIFNITYMSQFIDPLGSFFRQFLFAFFFI